MSGELSTPKKTRVQSICDFLDAKKIPHKRSEVFDWAGVSRASGFRILAADRALDPRTFHFNYAESRGRKLLFSDTDIQKMEQAITDKGWDGRTLDWAALPAAAGLDIQASVETIRTTMKKAGFLKELAEEGWNNLSQARINANIDGIPDVLERIIDAEGRMTVN